MNIVVGVFAMVIGLLAFWQRERASQLNRTWNERLGKPGEMFTDLGTAKYFGIGGILMAVAGAATVVYSLVTGQMGGSNDRTTAIIVLIIAAVGVVALGVVFAVMLYQRRAK